MKRRPYLKSALFILLLKTCLPGAVSAQTRAYAKYGERGETIGLFNLIRTATACVSWQVITGTIKSVRSQKRNKEMDYEVTLRTPDRLRYFVFTLGVDEIPRSDIGSLVMKARDIKLRACETKRSLLAEEITRME
jgi:hypothetical protein